jgi:hypothetical protein
VPHPSLPGGYTHGWLTAQSYPDCPSRECRSLFYSGIAPVLERSGKSLWVHRRLSRPIFVCQTFHEFAQQSTRFSSWADQFYRRQREKGKSHHIAIRSLAFKWIRIVFACWKANKPYDESLYTKALAKRNSSPSST